MKVHPLTFVHVGFVAMLILSGFLMRLLEMPPLVAVLLPTFAFFIYVRLEGRLYFLPYSVLTNKHAGLSASLAEYTPQLEMRGVTHISIVNVSKLSVLADYTWLSYYKAGSKHNFPLGMKDFPLDTLTRLDITVPVAVYGCIPKKKFSFPEIEKALRVVLEDVLNDDERRSDTAKSWQHSS